MSMLPPVPPFAWSHAAVAIVGAGPGDPELLTLKAARRIAEADVVLYDHLVDPSVPALARSEAQLICVGKWPGGPRTEQDEIHRLLLLHAKTGKRVVRLKGGDPFVFGRGGEEVLFLAAHGIATEIIPGVSSAIAAPSAAGIPVTHRGVATHFSVVTGSDSTPSETLAATWTRLAAAGGTVVFMMGLRPLPAIVAAVRAAGRPDDTPVAAIENATTHRQRTVIGTLADIVARVDAAELVSPATIVVGDVVALARDSLAPFDSSAPVAAFTASQKV